MKEVLRMAVVLTVVGVIAGAILAFANRVTREPIAQSKRAEKLAAMRNVLPEYDNDPIAEVCTINADGANWVFYIARRQGQFVGAAFETASAEGYSGTIRILAGVAADDTVQGVEIIEQTETPGLGAKISEPAFTDQFKRRSITATRWAVVKDGGDIQAITGATISPRAVVSALKKGLDVYLKNKEKIQASIKP